MKLEFSLLIFEKYWNQISWKSVQWEPGPMRTDGRTDQLSNRTLSNRKD